LQRPQLFRNLDGQKFAEVAPATAAGWRNCWPGGAQPSVISSTTVIWMSSLNNMDSSPALLRNAVKNNNHWIAFRLVGGPKSPRDAIGAKVFVTTSTIRQRADVFSGAVTVPVSDQRVHFGLGQSDKIDKIEFIGQAA